MESLTQTELIQENLDALPPYLARGAKLITDCFTIELMMEIKNLPVPAQLHFWAGVYLAVASNIKGATHAEAFKLIQEQYENTRREF